MQAIDDWQRDPTRGRNKRKIADMARNVRRVCDAAGWTDPHQIDGRQYASVVSGLTNQRDGTPLTVGAKEAYIYAGRAFANWLADRKLGMPGKIPAVIDGTPGTPRGAFSAEEVRRLLASAAWSGEAVRGVWPTRRVLLYLLAAHAGLRANEAKQVDPSCFQFDRRILRLPEHITKNGKAAFIPMSKRLMWWAKWVIRDDPKALPLRFSCNASELVHADMERAGIPIMVTEGGVDQKRDYHSLRHSFVTSLANNPKLSLHTARILARHSCLTTTQKYVHTPDTATQEAIQSVFG